MNLFYYILSYICYGIGHPLSVLTEFVAGRASRADWVIDILYTSACQYLFWSSDLDKNEWLWAHRHENETPDEFEQRCNARWPGRWKE